MSDLSELRKAAVDQDDAAGEGYESAISSQGEAKLFGMTAIERMFLSIGLFAITLVVSIILLIITESVSF